MTIQHGFDQACLHSNTGVAKSPSDDGQRGSIQRRPKPFVTGLDPGRAGGTGKPRNLSRLVGCVRLEGCKVFSRGKANIVEIRGNSGGNLVRIDAVDQVDHGHAFGAVVGNYAIQSVGRDCADNQGIRFVLRDALSDLVLLCCKILISPGLVEVESDTQSFCFVDQTEIDGQPIVVFEMRYRSAYTPRPAGPTGRNVLL